ncbi:unnamed protein product [Effrenium voratum]|nr:unnamed protein product [Effrenium voratum]
MFAKLRLVLGKGFASLRTPGSSLDLWVSILERLDSIETANLMETSDLKRLRQLCLQKDSRLAILHRTYSKEDMNSYPLLVSRLQELLELDGISRKSDGEVLRSDEKAQQPS